MAAGSVKGLDGHDFDAPSHLLLFFFSSLFSLEASVVAVELLLRSSWVPLHWTVMPHRPFSSFSFSSPRTRRRKKWKEEDGVEGSQRWRDHQEAVVVVDAAVGR